MYPNQNYNSPRTVTSNSNRPGPTNTNTSSNFVLEPYGINTGRRVVSTEDQAPAEKPRLDQDWIHAYSTYSPYKTSNQEYGLNRPIIRPTQDIYPIGQNRHNQVPDNPSQGNPNVKTFGPPLPPSPRGINLLTRYGLPPLAYRTPRSQMNW